MSNEPQPSDLLAEFAAVAAQAGDDAAVQEMVLNALVGAMTAPLKQTLVQAAQTANMVALRQTLTGAAGPPVSLLTRYALAHNPDVFLGRLEIALREILRRELAGQ